MMDYKKKSAVKASDTRHRYGDMASAGWGGGAVGTRCCCLAGPHPHFDGGSAALQVAAVGGTGRKARWRFQL